MKISTGHDLIGAIDKFKPAMDRIEPSNSTQSSKSEPSFKLLHKSTPVLLLAVGAGLLALLYFAGKKVDDYV